MFVFPTVPRRVTVSRKDRNHLCIWVVGDPRATLELSRGLSEGAARVNLNSIVHIACVDQGKQPLDGIPVAVIAVPSLRTWSRLRHGSRKGPPPLRNSAWPWGVPSLTGVFREEVEEANRCLRHCLSILGFARKRSFETGLL